MTHVLWGMIKDTLIKLFVDLNTEYYDLSLPHREETADAIREHSLKGNGLLCSLRNTVVLLLSLIHIFESEAEESILSQMFPARKCCR